MCWLEVGAKCNAKCEDCFVCNCARNVGCAVSGCSEDTGCIIILITINTTTTTTTIIIIIITRPKPASSRQGLAAVLLCASGAQLGRGKCSFFRDRHELHYNINIIIITIVHRGMCSVRLLWGQRLHVLLIQPAPTRPGPPWQRCPLPDHYQHHDHRHYYQLHYAVHPPASTHPGQACPTTHAPRWQLRIFPIHHYHCDHHHQHHHHHNRILICPL